MTSKEAKKILNEYRNRNYTSTLKDEVELAMAIDAVLPKYVKLEERDTPKKFVIGTSKGFRFPICPNCKTELNEYYKDANKFCKKCGQRIDWSE